MRTKISFKVIVLIAMVLPLLLLLFLPVAVKGATNIAVTPSSGTVGMSVLLTGDGFVGRLATVYWDGQVIAQKVPISEEGNLNYSFDVPTACKGNHVIKITDDSNWSGSEKSVTFCVLPRIKIFPPVGLVWGGIIVSGDGFAANESGIRVTWDDNVLPVILGFSADWRGSWSVTFDIPQPAEKGDHFVGAFGDITTAAEVDKVLFILAPVAYAKPVSGPVGTEVLVSGIGFRLGEDGLTITYDGEIIKCNIVGGIDGSWDSTVVIPQSTRGHHEIGVYGSSFTPIGVVPKIDFEVTPQISLQSVWSKKGTKVMVIGTGFVKEEAVTIDCDAIELSTAVADNIGSFSVVCEIPLGGGRERVITAIGSAGNSARANFVIANPLPQTPQLFAPMPDAQLEIFSSFGDVIFGTARYLAGIFDYFRGSQQKSLKPSLATFVWTRPVDSSEVSYVLQIASTNDFSSPVLVKEGIINSSYTLSEDDVLVPGRYFWRVKATDDIGNESEWSEVWEFEVIWMSNRFLIVSLVSFVLLIAVAVFGVLTWRINRSAL